MHNIHKLLTSAAALMALSAGAMESPSAASNLAQARAVLGGEVEATGEDRLQAARTLVENIGQLAENEGMTRQAVESRALTSAGNLGPQEQLATLQALFRDPSVTRTMKIVAAQKLVGHPMQADVDPDVLRQAQAMAALSAGVVEDLNDNPDLGERIAQARAVLGGEVDATGEGRLQAVHTLIENIGRWARDERTTREEVELNVEVGIGHMEAPLQPIAWQVMFQDPNVTQPMKVVVAQKLVDHPMPADVDPDVLQQARAFLAAQ
ncbi:MAG: hypothetical protein LBJ70_05180 [Holosporales bacterium]|nr:hypothetical protein [Holosporales bacterium]